MGRTNIRGLVALGLATLLMAGCATKSEPEDTTDTMPGSETPTMDSSSGSGTGAAPEAAKPMIKNGQIFIPLDDMGSGTEGLQGIFYFDFDQAIVKRAGHAELDKHAKVLSGNPSFRVRLEGHADERGTREYNLALGERRANAVRAYLVAQGASRSQIEVISYGEEKPAVAGSGESSWAKNRRVEIKYK